MCGYTWFNFDRHRVEKVESCRRHFFFNSNTRISYKIPSSCTFVSHTIVSVPFFFFQTLEKNNPLISFVVKHGFHDQLGAGLCMRHNRTFNIYISLFFESGTLQN